MDLGLKDKIAFVAGASKGLAAATARQLAREGARVAINSRDAARLNAAADSIRAETGAQVIALVGDVAVAADVERLIGETARHFGGLDIVITNSGGPPPGRFDELSDEAWLQSVDLLLMSNVRFIRAALPHLRRQRRGVVINTTSIAARNGGGFGVSLYAAAKGAVEALSRNLAREEAQYGIRVNCVAPGYIDTPIHEVSSPEQLKRYLDATPLARAGLPQDCVGIYLLLACERLGGFITGQTIGVNGGMHLN